MIWSRIWLLTWAFRLTKLHSRVRESQQAQKYRLPTKFSGGEPATTQVSESQVFQVKAFTEVLDSGMLIRVYSPFGTQQSLCLSYSSTSTVQGSDLDSLICLLKSHLMLMTSRSVSLDSQPIFSIFLKFLLGCPSDILNSTRTNLLDLSPYSSVNGVSQPHKLKSLICPWVFPLLHSIFVGLQVLLVYVPSTHHPRVSISLSLLQLPYSFISYRIITTAL